MVCYTPHLHAPLHEILMDLHGRTMRSTRLGDGPGLLQWDTQGMAPGLYVAELRMDGQPGQQVKVVVQR